MFDENPRNEKLTIITLKDQVIYDFFHQVFYSPFIFIIYKCIASALFTNAILLCLKPE